MNASNVNVSSPGLLISRAAMVHNHWSVSCGVEVLSFTYSWSRWNGGDHWDRGSHPGGDCAYGSGAFDGSGTASSICWVRWDDARYDGEDCPEGRERSRFQRAVMAVSMCCLFSSTTARLMALTAVRRYPTDASTRRRFHPTHVC